MYEHILVPLDGSVVAEKALPHATVLAGRFGATVHLLRVLPDHMDVFTEARPDGGYIPSMPGEQEKLEVESKEASTYLERVAALLRAQNVTVTAETARGAVPEAIMRTAVDRGASLIVMTSHARVGLSHLLLGSVAERVLREGGRPVLLIHPS